MAKSKRIQITPSPQVLALVDEVQKLNGQSKSAIISELLDQIAPVLQNMIEALKLLQEQPREAQRLMQNMANETVGMIAQASLDLDAAMDSRTVQGKRSKTGGLRGRPTP